MPNDWQIDKERRALAEVETFLNALDRQSQALLAYARRAEKKVEKGVNLYAEYVLFLDRAQEFEAFAQLIEDRVGDLRKEVRPLLRRQFDQINLLILGTLVRARMAFLGRIHRNNAAPLGTREFFEADLRRIDHAIAKAEAAPGESRPGEDVLGTLRQSREILLEIIAGAISLKEFRAAQTKRAARRAAPPDGVLGKRPPPR